MKIKANFRIYSIIALITLISVMTPSYTKAQTTTIDFEEFVDNTAGGGEFIGNEHLDKFIEFTTTGIHFNIASPSGGSVALGADEVADNDFNAPITLNFRGNGGNCGRFATDLTFDVCNGGNNDNIEWTATLCNGDTKSGTIVDLGACPVEGFQTVQVLSNDNVSELTIDSSFYIIDNITYTSVDDSTGPVISCNVPATITPPDAPISFTATATDDCNTPTVQITGYECFAFTKKGKRIDKSESCDVYIGGISPATINIIDTGGIGTHIKWYVLATDACGNTDVETCEVLVGNPGRGLDEW